MPFRFAANTTRDRVWTKTMLTTGVASQQRPAAALMMQTARSIRWLVPSYWTARRPTDDSYMTQCIYIVYKNTHIKNYIQKTVMQTFVPFYYFNTILYIILYRYIYIYTYFNKAGNYLTQYI